MFTVSTSPLLNQVKPQLRPCKQVTTANTSWDGLEKYWYHTSTENEQLKINREKEQQTGTASQRKKKEHFRTKHPNDGSPKLQQLQATTKIDKKEPHWVEQLLFWDCETNNDFHGHGDDGLFAIKANNQAMTLLPGRSRRASQLTIRHKTHLQQQPCKSRVPSQPWCRSLQDRLFDDRQHCKQRVRKSVSLRQHTDEKHVYRWKKIGTDYQNGK